MLKPRLIATLLVKDGWCVRSINFSDHFPIGQADIAASYLNRWSIDEILLLDISVRRSKPNLSLLKTVADTVISPLTYGGGIHTVADACQVIQGGADKVCISTAAADSNEIIEKAVESLGSQGVLTCVDYRIDKDGGANVFVENGRRCISKNIAEYCLELQSRGVGEIILQSIDHDGQQCGYDVTTIKEISAKLDIPLIAAAGAGKPQHLSTLFQDTEVSGVAVGNALHFSEHSVHLFRSALLKEKVPLRNDSYIQYDKNTINQLGRLERKSEEELIKLRFERFEEETI